MSTPYEKLIAAREEIDRLRANKARREATDTCFDSNDPNGDGDGPRIEMLCGSKALAKACQDPFDYALRLRTGEVVLFTEAWLLNKEWVRLEVKPTQPPRQSLPYPAPRGIDVRLSDIVWVMDAPEGS